MTSSAICTRDFKSRHRASLPLGGDSVAAASRDLEALSKFNQLWFLLVHVTKQTKIFITTQTVLHTFHNFVLNSVEISQLYSMTQLSERTTFKHQHPTYAHVYEPTIKWFPQNSPNNANKKKIDQGTLKARLIEEKDLFC